MSLLAIALPAVNVYPLIPPKGEGWEWETGGRGMFPSVQHLTTSQFSRYEPGCPLRSADSQSQGGQARRAGALTRRGRLAPSQSSVRASHWHCYNESQARAHSALSSLTQVWDLEFQCFHCFHVTSGQHRKLFAKRLLFCVIKIFFFEFKYSTLIVLYFRMVLLVL